MADIISITKEVIDLFEKHELSKVQCMFVVEAVKMGINEELTKDIIAESKKGYDDVGHAGIH